MAPEDHDESNAGPHDRVLERIRRFGPLRFDEVMEAALYDPDGGFYTTGGSAGRRRGDFVTSAEVGPLFGACLARAFDTWWHDAGRPDPFVVVEAGAGRGALARSVIDAAPDCLAALHYVLVERSESLRARQRDLLDLEEPALALRRGAGPVVTSLAELPRQPFTGVVWANELLDNLPVRVLERTAAGWSELRVGVAPGSEDRADLVEVLVPAPDELADPAARLAPAAPVGGRLALQSAALEWLRSAHRICRRGRVVVFDYVADSPQLAARPADELLRTYRGHDRGTDPLTALGAQDITCDVAVDQLVAGVGPCDADRSQREFLMAHGIEDLVEEGRRVWTERAHLGDLEAVRARSRISEAEALTDPEGLGAFRVLEWARG